MRRWLLVSVLCVSPASAAVKSVGENGFAIEHSVVVAATPERVYAATVEPARWWNSSHSWSGDAANLTLDARAGGCFCEKLSKSGGFAEHARVIFAQPGRMLRLSGALGPLQGEGVTGTLSFALEPGAAAGTTKLTVSYVVGGYVRSGTAGFAAPVDAVIGEQTKRLAAFASERTK